MDNLHFFLHFKTPPWCTGMEMRPVLKSPEETWSSRDWRRVWASGYPGRGVDAWERSVAALAPPYPRPHTPPPTPLLLCLLFSFPDTLIIAKIRQRGCVLSLSSSFLFFCSAVFIRPKILNLLISHLTLSGKHRIAVITLKLGQDWGWILTHSPFFTKLSLLLLLFSIFKYFFVTTIPPPPPPPPPLPNHPSAHVYTHTHFPVLSFHPGVMIRCQISFL